ncbi:MAG: OB-fold domain-containing protein [Actinomycetota bacterium]
MSQQTSAEKTAYTKPLPDMRPDGVKFWEGTKEHKLLLPTDTSGKPFWYPRALAPGNLDEVQWVESTGEGTIYTYSIHYIGPSKAYKGDPPHIVALVDLDEGVRLMTNIVKDEEGYPSIDPADVSIGQRVRVVFHDVTDEITLPKFTPA